MTFNATLFDPTQICLELDPARQDQIWNQSQSCATDISRWNTYLNQLCLEAVLPWLREEEGRSRPLFNATARSSLWELVSGMAIALGDIQIVLLPTEQMDLDEIRIPQEWIDIPDWVADYYLAVQVNPDDGWVSIGGFATHAQIKERAPLDQGDRTYVLDEMDWITDLNVLWVSRQLQANEVTRAAVATLPELETTQARNLIQRLGTPEIRVPRLEIPFTTWAALVQNSGWRQQLAERRRGQPEQRSVPQWLQSGLSALAEQVGWQSVTLQPVPVGARSDQATQPVPGLARSLTIAGQPYELRVMPISTPEGQIWRFELVSLTPGGRIPRGFVLRLLTENLQPFAGNEDQAETSVDALYVEVILTPGEGIVWQIEPAPDDYDQELLRF
jgi:hypothetical protein